MRTHRLFTVVMISLSIGILAGCTPSSPPSGDEQPTQVGTDTEQAGSTHGRPLQIVTTFPPLYSHVTNLADANDTVTNLVPPGSSVHFWQPKPSDLVAMEQADMIVINGLGLEEFLEDYLDQLADQGVQIVDTSRGIGTLEYQSPEINHDEGHDSTDDHNDDKHDLDDEDHHHDHDGPDPHIWLDPMRATQQVETIRQALIRLDDSQADTYTTQADAYTDTIRQLDAQIEAQLTERPVGSFIVFHDAYQYFLRRYGLDDRQVGLIQEFHGDNPSQRQIAELIETVETTGVTTIYTEPQFDPLIVQRLQQETDITTREIDPIGSTLSQDSYTTMLQKLADAFSTN